MLTISIFGLLLSLRQEISELEIEVSGLENQVEDLIEMKKHYIKVIQHQKEIESNLNIKIKLLEDNIVDLQEKNEKLRTIRAKLTAYSPLDNVDGQQAEGNPNRTSIGKKVSRGIVAADPKKLPYGTKLEIPGWGQVIVGDTGGALRSDNKNIRIDVFMSTYKEAIHWGVKDMDIKILEWGDKN